MMVRLTDTAINQVLPFCATSDLDEIKFSAWIAEAQPGETLVYHRGFLALDVTRGRSRLTADRQRVLRRIADAALHAAEQSLIHLVQTRIGPAQFAYLAIARPKPDPPGAAHSLRLRAAA